jgi:hypothetical protein
MFGHCGAHGQIETAVQLVEEFEVALESLMFGNAQRQQFLNAGGCAFNRDKVQPRCMKMTDYFTPPVPSSCTLPKFFAECLFVGFLHVGVQAKRLGMQRVAHRFVEVFRRIHCVKRQISVSQGAGKIGPLPGSVAVVSGVCALLEYGPCLLGCELPQLQIGPDF